MVTPHCEVPMQIYKLRDSMSKNEAEVCPMKLYNLFDFLNTLLSAGPTRMERL